MSSAIGWSDVPGETPEPDCELLIELVRELADDALIVDLGSLVGRSGLAMASVCRGSQHVYMVDRFEPGPHLDQGGWVTPSLEAIRENISKTGLGEWCTVVQSDSVAAAELFEDGSVSLLFVDASHDQESVEADLRAWLPKMKGEGVAALHDYADYAPGVIAAANGVFGRGPDKIHYLVGVYRGPFQAVE
jgi:predicted O-methyltransferase YrrM